MLPDMPEASTFSIEIWKERSLSTRPQSINSTHGGQRLRERRTSTQMADPPVLGPMLGETVSKSIEMSYALW